MFTYEMRPRRITACPFRTRLGSVPGHGPAGRLWTRFCSFVSFADPFEERDEVAILVERREFARAVLGRAEAVLVVQDLAAEPVAVELDCGGRVPHGHGRAPLGQRRRI